MVTGKAISSSLVIYQLELDCRTFAPPARPLHLHRQIIFSQNLVTDIKKTLTHSKIDTRIAYPRNISSKIAIRESILLAMCKSSPFPCPNPMWIWYLTRKAIGKGKILQHSPVLPTCPIQNDTKLTAKLWCNPMISQICAVVASIGFPRRRLFETSSIPPWLNHWTWAVISTCTSFASSSPSNQSSHPTDIFFLHYTRTTSWRTWETPQ